MRVNEIEESSGPADNRSASRVDSGGHRNLTQTRRSNSDALICPLPCALKFSQPMEGAQDVAKSKLPRMRQSCFLKFESRHPMLCFDTDPSQPIAQTKPRTVSEEELIFRKLLNDFTPIWTKWGGSSLSKHVASWSTKLENRRLKQWIFEQNSGAGR